MKKFEKIFTKLTKQHEHTITFNDFLDYTIDQFLINKDKKAKLFNFKQYTEKEHEYFFELFTELIYIMDKKLEKNSWYDALGIFYEDIIQSKWKADKSGQFFTPIAVTELLAQLSKNNDDEIKYIYDPACGSGRTLLAYHTKRKYDICIGWDLDPTSVKMSVINFILHGIKGSVCHMDSLKGEYYTGFKINEMIDYGMPFTVMRCDNYSDCISFLGEKIPEPAIINNTVLDIDDAEKKIIEKQTTLI